MAVLRQTDEHHARCQDCGHVGDRVFVLAPDGHWRDVLGGATGLRADHCVCSRCEGEHFDLVPAERG